MSVQAPPLRGIVAGLGVMGTNHLRVLRGMPGVRIVAVVDPDSERRTIASAAELRAHGSLAEALDAHEADFACLAVPVGSLAAAGHEALAAGLHVLVEKPTAATEEQALALVRDAEARGRLLAVGHVERFNPAVVALRDRIEEGLIGRVHQMHARRLSPFPNRGGVRGVALDLATHDIDVMRFASGQEVQRVYAETAGPLGTGFEDLLCATLRFDDETTGLLETNWMTPTKVRQLSVLGERGMLVVDYLMQTLEFYEHPNRATEWDALAAVRGGGEGDMIRYALDRREPLRVQWEAFLGAVRSGGEAPVDGRDGLAALSTARAILRSGELHEAVVPSYRAAVDEPVA
ncbi:MAG: Gfo/Idh/MocA family oxidoreductase [Actinomycetota bacterium]|nr:Gfo/Idh/MocA family oxidoreductase [Actinomycetota bacterium]